MTEHSRCGGVRRCPDTLADGFEAELRDIKDSDEQLHILEQKAVLTSLTKKKNLPPLAEDVAQGTLALHGLWSGTGSGVPDWYGPETDAFHAL
ncbi:MAG: hypothetical protein AAGA19_11590 [Pseudomonadota bacterium]